jgi:hypothetical protein
MKFPKYFLIFRTFLYTPLIIISLIRDDLLESRDLYSSRKTFSTLGLLLPQLPRKVAPAYAGWRNRSKGTPSEQRQKKSVIANSWRMPGMWQSPVPETSFLFESIPETHLNAEIASPSMARKDSNHQISLTTSLV